MTSEYMHQYTAKKAAESLPSILSKDGASIVITGDSLAYNRYGFEPDHQVNAYNCYPGIRSWSFMLRDAIHQDDEWYVFGDEIIFKHPNPVKLSESGYEHRRELAKQEPGNLHEQDDYHKYSKVNHGKVSTLVFNEEAPVNSFEYSHLNKKTNKTVIYYQKRPDMYSCTFDIHVDGELATAGVSNKGNIDRFKGWELFDISIPVPGDGKAHEISFRNVKNIAGSQKALDTDCSNKGSNNEQGQCFNGESRITIAGVGTKSTGIYLTGCGGRPASFFLENIDERILNYKPDFLIFIIGANDRISITPRDFEADLKSLITRIKTVRTDCEILLITPPSSRDPEQPAADKLPYFVSDAASKPFVDAMYRIGKEYGCMLLDLFELFGNVPVKEWRFDSVHFTKYGNTCIARAILDMIFPRGGNFRKELINADLWFDEAKE